MDLSGATPAMNHDVRSAPRDVVPLRAIGAHAIEIGAGDSDLAVRWSNAADALFLLKPTALQASAHAKASVQLSGETA